jgi:hypothetical protein
MNTKEIVVYGLNVLVALGAFALVYTGKIGWIEAVGLITVLLVPSAGHVAVQRLKTK